MLYPPLVHTVASRSPNKHVISCRRKTQNVTYRTLKSVYFTLECETVFSLFPDAELGPLDPDWFQVLTAQTFTGEGSVSDPDDLCANQEGHFKTPLDKAALDSQLFSTPKVFRHRRVVSPETTEGEQSFTPEQGNVSFKFECFLMLSRTVDVCILHIEFIIINCVQRFLNSMFLSVSYAKQISESLGAQIHPDISWTSSLNTPPALWHFKIASETIFFFFPYI
uniref:Uncharacterized protein n=1 Tax=Scophthalmus maximus TaxID=52904 RepID=A0A8D3EDB8_SCOMX